MLILALPEQSYSKTPGGVEAFDEKRSAHFDQAFSIKFPISRISHIPECGNLTKNC
jgi:hypothetical protein